jgi:threonine/homoserine/homoserine lactone efflux protein
MLLRPDLLVPFITFTFVMAYTPGPNNSLLMTSGLNFGLKHTLPALIGVWVGFNFLTFCTFLGLGAFFLAWPLAYTILKYIGAAYMLYLAWMIANAGGPSDNPKHKGRPFTFLEGAALQLLNVKAWVVGVGAVSTYAGIAAYPANAFLMSAIFMAAGVGSTFAWAYGGVALQRLLHKPKLLRAFNIAMGILLAASILPAFFE